MKKNENIPVVENENFRLVKELSILVLIGVLCYGVYYLITAEKEPKYDQEKCIVVTLTDEYEYLYKAFILDLETKEVFDEEYDKINLRVQVGVEPGDYDRIHAGGVTEDELEQFKFYLDDAFGRAEIGFSTRDNDGNVIEHYHFLSDEAHTVVKPSEPCEDCRKFAEYKAKANEN